MKKVFLKKLILTLVTFLCLLQLNAQVSWTKVTEGYGELPKGFELYFTNDSLDGQPFKAWYAIADLKNKELIFTTDTTQNRRLTPNAYYTKNDKPLLVVNTSFFSYETNSSLNLVIKDGEMVGFNQHNTKLKGKDSLLYRHAFTGVLGISKKGKADIAWAFTDSNAKYPVVAQQPILFYKDSVQQINVADLKRSVPGKKLKKWKQETAVGGGPVLVQNGVLQISNNEELKFSGEGLNDKHPRTLMGYTANNKLIVMVIQGRMPGIAMGASLVQEAKLMQQLGCLEALNLDGGGSSCMLVNGKETIVPSSKGEQRSVPAVFIIKQKSK